MGGQKVREKIRDSRYAREIKNMMLEKERPRYLEANDGKKRRKR